MRVLTNIVPSPEQLKILSDARPGFRLIRGAAGSGKTTAALLRLRQLSSSRLARRDRLRSTEPVRVLVLTFNRTLCAYVSELARERVQSSNALRLTIDTFAGWALNMVGTQNLISGPERRRRIRNLLSGSDHLRQNLDFFADEVEYVLGRFPPERREDYLAARRSGLGRAPAVPRHIRKMLLSGIIEPYEAQIAQRGEADWNDVAVEASNSQGDRYDVVVDDEAQDLSGNQIRAILAHLDEDHATTFIIDAVQRIYPQGFLWREVGIDFRPQMVFPLSRNHRNTKDIARFAAS